MADACCGGTSRPGHFHCHGCGSCCTNLQGRWARDRGRFASLPQAGIYRAPTPGGLRMFSWEAAPFQEDVLRPLLVVPDARSGQVVVLAWELDAPRCPRYDGEAGCTIYGDHPLVCRAYPLLLREGDEGLSVATSGLCPAKVPVVGAAKASADPERVLAGLYPNEVAAALAVPALMDHLASLAEFLTAAEVVEPVHDLEEEGLEAWLSRGVLDLVAVVEQAGVMDREDLQGRQQAVLTQLRARLVDR